MTRFLLRCCCALFFLTAAQACVSPSRLGTSALKCSQEELARLDLPPLSASPWAAAEVGALGSLGSGEAATLKAAVFNIRSGFGPSNDREPSRVRARLARIAYALSTAAPDIIALNEVDFHSRRTGFIDQAQYIAERLQQLGFSYQVVRGPAWVRDESGREIRYGNALLVRHPVVRVRHCSFSELAGCDASPSIDNLPPASLSAPWSWLSHEPRGVVMADFRWHDHTVRAIVTHLDPFSAQLRETQAAQVIAGLVPPTGPVVLLGDMNTVPTRLTLERTWFTKDRTHDVLTSGRLFDARSELGGDDALNWERWATYPSNDPRWPLDGVFATPDLAAVDLRVMGSGLSDHLGLIGTLVPISDAAALEARVRRLALRRAGRFRRLSQCDLPDPGQSSFFSWLRAVTASDKPSTASAAAPQSRPR